MLEKVKMALRINHDFLNSALEEEIANARTDMIRAGVSSEIANDDDNALVVGCILTFCKFVNATKDDATRFWESYTYQLDCLRKSTL